VRRGLARTFQINTLFPHLTALESVTLSILEREGHAHNWWRALSSFSAASDEAAGDSQVFAILDKNFSRKHANSPTASNACSEIALALATRPRVLLLDEPAAGVAQGRKRGALRRGRRPVERAHGAVHRARHGRRVPLRQPHPGDGRRPHPGRGHAAGDSRATMRVREVYLGAGHAA